MPIRKVPFDYRHPNKSPSSDKRNTGPSKPIAASGRTKKKKKAAGSGLTPAQPHLVHATSHANSVRLVAYPPPPGEHGLFDRMVDSGISKRQAILGLFRLGFAAIETGLAEGTLVDNAATDRRDIEAIETTRTTSPEILAAARLLYDPFGVLSKRALGLKLGQAILRATNEKGS